MDIQIAVQDAVTLANPDSHYFQDKDTVDSYKEDVTMKENLRINDMKFQPNSTFHLNNQLNGKYYNPKVNNFRSCAENGNNENEHQEIGEQKSSTSIDSISNSHLKSDSNYVPEYKNFRLEWDKENNSLYIIIPSVDSLDHWMMLFLQPLGITNDSFCIKNCCAEGNCDFKIRLDDERLLLYPDLLRDISEFINLQSKLWHRYVSTVILRDRDSLDDSIQNSKNPCHSLLSHNDQIFSSHILPDINVFFNDRQESDIKINGYMGDNIISYCEKDPHKPVICNFQQTSKHDRYCSVSDTNKVQSGTTILYNNAELYNNAAPLSCLTTGASDSNILTTDPAMLPVITSDDSNTEQSYFNTSTDCST